MTPREQAAEAAHAEAVRSADDARRIADNAALAARAARAELDAARCEADDALPRVLVCSRDTWGRTPAPSTVVVTRRTKSTIWTRYRGTRGDEREFRLGPDGRWVERGGGHRRTYPCWLDPDSVAALVGGAA